MLQKKQFSFIAISALVTVFVVYFLITVVFKKTEDKKDEVVYVQTVPILSKPIERTYQTVATLQAEQMVIIKNQIAGQVKRIHKLAGEMVRKGELLLTLEPHTEVKSPIDGYLTDWQVKEGQFLSTGTVLSQVVNKKSLFVRYYVPEQMGQQLELGQKVYIRFQPGTRYIYEGKVDYISPIVEPKNHSIMIKASIENPDEILMPGRFVYITQQLEVIQNALVAPESCVVQSIDGYHLFTVKDNKAVKKQIEIGARKEQEVEIKSGILQEDVCIIAISPNLTDGGDVVAKAWVDSSS